MPRNPAIPANNRTGTIKDVEHIIFMMQENRSFDDYFGTLRGVRGYFSLRAGGCVHHL
jgi:phospholipase C